ncbi:hypothetical protein ACWDQO_06875 [Streptomyces sp. NPDC003703]|uniref:hypothetical protein n=1 Tax=Streptomyces sp. NPDC003283 TaxID=3364681 RepID=UPI0036D091C0
MGLGAESAAGGGVLGAGVPGEGAGSGDTRVLEQGDAYQPTSTTVTIPAEAGASAGTYNWTYGYNDYTGQQTWIKHPAVGNLPSERQATVYGQGNLPEKTAAGLITLVNATSHDVFSRPVRTEYGTLGKKLYNTQTYDEFTGRLTRQTTDRDLAPQRIDDVTYAYDDAGNITGVMPGQMPRNPRRDAGSGTIGKTSRLTRLWPDLACALLPQLGPAWWWVLASRQRSS